MDDFGTIEQRREDTLAAFANQDEPAAPLARVSDYCPRCGYPVWDIPAGEPCPRCERTIGAKA